MRDRSIVFFKTFHKRCYNFVVSKKLNKIVLYVDVMQNSFLQVNIYWLNLFNDVKFSKTNIFKETYNWCKINGIKKLLWNLSFKSCLDLVRSENFHRDFHRGNCSSRTSAPRCICSTSCRRSRRREDSRRRRCNLNRWIKTEITTIT